MNELLLILPALVLWPGAEPETSRIVVEPREIDDLLSNPGMGWQTFHRFADEDRNLEGIPSSSAYFRFYWSEIEPEEGRIDFEKLDGLLSRARRAGQKLAFRIMCAGTRRDYLYVPKWLKEKGCPGFEYRYGGKGPLHWIPDMDHPIFQKAHFRLIRELGKRYDGHPDLDLVDIGTVGHWGEWHMSSTDVELPGLKTRFDIIEEYCNAFRRTPKAMLIGDKEGMIHAVHMDCGWRADCLGDMGGFSRTWNHMDNFYRQQIEKTGAEEAWKVAPVAFESCWDMRKWKEEGWNIRYIFDYALKLHASYLNNKSAPIPGGTRPEIERFLRRLGYRLVLRKLEHERAVSPGSMLEARLTWENRGVAPPYRDNFLALRLKGRETGEIHILPSDISIKGWLPGRIEKTLSLELPGSLRPGVYDLALAVVDSATRSPCVRLAISGREEDGWYPLSRIEVSGR